MEAILNIQNENAVARAKRYRQKINFCLVAGCFFGYIGKDTIESGLSMKVIGLLSLSLIWGQLSTHFFYRAWISFLGILCCVIGFFRTSAPAKKLLSASFNRISESIFFFLLLFSGFFLIYHHLQYGQTRMEVFIFFLSATVRMMIILPKLNGSINEIWEIAEKPKKKDPDNSP